MHPGWLRCSSLTDPRYAQSSRLASRAPRPPRCDAGVPPRALGGPEAPEPILDDARDHGLLLLAAARAHGELDHEHELVQAGHHEALALLGGEVRHVGQHLLEVGAAVLLEVHAR